jgi:hypothetical protein
MTVQKLRGNDFTLCFSDMEEFFIGRIVILLNAKESKIVTRREEV